MDYQPTIGLEIHAELKTRTKMFCDCQSNPLESKPNVNVCPVCLAHPGTLPAINRLAVEAVIRTGLALGGTINVQTKFDRKNYFYPDLPKGYQISQYDQPLVVGGNLNGIRITRIHLEEDTGRLLHVTSDNGQWTGSQRSNVKSQMSGESLVDFNRAGVPLMELVTEPDVRSSAQAVEFAKDLQRILRYLGVSEADMEKGQMRIEANVSLSADGGMGTKVELKNINSFKAVEAAVEYEISRQKQLLEKGEKVVQETRGWNENKRQTVHQRFKEEAHDYRYFPEPDLPPFETAGFDPERLKRELPELPAQKYDRLTRQYGLSAHQAWLLVDDRQLSNFFEEAVSEYATYDKATTSSVSKRSQELLFNYLTTDLRGLINQAGIRFDEVKALPEHLAHLVSLIEAGKIGSRQAKDILKIMVETGEDPENILVSKELHTVSDENTLGAVIAEVIKENPAAASDFKKGKTESMQFMIGKVMQKLKGRGNPAAVRTFLESELAKQ